VIKFDEQVEGSNVPCFPSNQTAMTSVTIICRRKLPLCK